MSASLRIIRASQVQAQLRDPVEADVLAGAEKIVADVRAGGDAALRHFAEKFSEVSVGAPLTLSHASCGLPFFDQVPSSPTLRFMYASHPMASSDSAG